MNDHPKTLAAAQLDVERSRARLTATAAELHDRLKPDVLVRQGVYRIRARGNAIADEVMDVARAQPVLIGGVGAGMLLLWLRRPIARLGRRLFFRSDETDPVADRLNATKKF